MSIYSHANDTNGNVKHNNINNNNLPPILSIKNGKFTNLIRNTNRPEGRRSGASDGYVGKSRIRDRSNPRIIQFFNNSSSMATSNAKSNSDGRSSSSANAKNRNFISFLALNQQNEKKRLKSQITKMCSISFKKLDAVDDSTTMPCVIKNSNYTKSNLINLSDFTNKFESLDLNQKENGDDDDDEGGDDDLRKISILNNYFSNSILSNYNNVNVNNNDAAGKSNDESNLDTQRTSNNYNNNSTSFNKNRPESLLSDRCKSEGFDEEIQYDNDNDNENYFDM
jgi:hypothetical protein